MKAYYIKFVFDNAELYVKAMTLKIEFEEFVKEDNSNDKL